MTPTDVIDELAWRGPPRLAVRAIRIRERTQRLVERYRAGVERIRKVAVAGLVWLAGVALALLYLLVCSYLDREDLATRNERLRKVGSSLLIDNARLNAQLAELTATRTQKLIYLIEADSSAQAKEKLSRIGMMVAADHFLLQEATREKK